MAVFTLLILALKFIELLGSEYDDVWVLIEPPPPQNILQLSVHDTLNLTCSLSKPQLNGDIHLEWNMPSKIGNRQNQVDKLIGTNSLNLVIRDLQETDSGEYKCTASSNTNPDIQLEKSIRVNVKRKRGCAHEMMFRCHADLCIHKRFTCDGKKDCMGGEDESEALCGLHVCRNKIHCDGRCIPSSWCCEPPLYNCTIRHQCCKPPRGTEEQHIIDSHVTQRYNDVAFFQTTVYTVIGCAMAFMLIVTILVIAICRVQMRRALPGRPPSSHSYPLPFHDIDYLFAARPPANPLMVTYNINNGVQFVGRPVDPPPYCETVAVPPREGPPPPYVSTENLARSSENLPRRDMDATSCENIARSSENLPRRDMEDESCETDALLTPAEQPISIISARSLNDVTSISCEVASQGNISQTDSQMNGPHVGDEF